MRRLTNLVASNEVGLVLVILLFGAGFATASPGFTSPFNLYALSRVFAIDAVIGMGMMVVIVTGGLNLALGAIGVCSVMLGGWLMQVAGLPASAARSWPPAPTPAPPPSRACRCRARSPWRTRSPAPWVRWPA